MLADNYASDSAVEILGRWPTNGREHNFIAGFWLQQLFAATVLCQILKGWSNFFSQKCPQHWTLQETYDFAVLAEL